MEMGNKALIITGENVQDHEFIYPYYRLKEEGFDVIVALKNGVTKGILGTKIPCDDNCEIVGYDELEGVKNRYDLKVLILPGGAKCMEKLRQESLVLDFISKWDKKEKPIFSICHGAQLLISAKVVKDRKIAGYYSIKDDIINAGGIYSDTFVRDKNIFSASHYKYLGEWMRWINSL